MSNQVLLTRLKRFLLLAFFGITPSISSELDLDKQKFIEEFQSLSDQIEHHFCSGNELMHLYVERGNLLLIAEEFASAIDDYTYAIHFKTDSSHLYRKMLCQALWGRMLAYAFLENQKEAVDDVYLISETLCNDFSKLAELEGLDISLCKKKNKS